MTMIFIAKSAAQQGAEEALTNYGSALDRKYGMMRLVREGLTLLSDEERAELARLEEAALAAKKASLNAGLDHIAAVRKLVGGELGDAERATVLAAYGVLNA